MGLKKVVILGCQELGRTLCYWINRPPCRHSSIKKSLSIASMHNQSLYSMHQHHLGINSGIFFPSHNILDMCKCSAPWTPPLYDMIFKHDSLWHAMVMGPQERCSTCIKRKQRREPSPKEASKRATQPLELVGFIYVGLCKRPHLVVVSISCSLLMTSACRPRFPFFGTRVNLFLASRIDWSQHRRSLGV